MKLIYCLFIFVCLPQFLFSQDSNTIEYKISMIGSPQEIYLIKDNNGKYSGYIDAEFYRRRQKFLGIVHRKPKYFTIKTNLDAGIVQLTIEQLQKAGIDNMEQCSSNPECNAINFLDADFLVFKIKNSKEYEQFEFKEVYPENTKKDNIEKNALRRKAQILITIVNENLQLKDKFKSVLKQIKKPYCFECGGISSCCSVKKKK